MRFDAEEFRKGCKENDTKRDTGLKTPDNMAESPATQILSRSILYISAFSATHVNTVLMSSNAAGNGTYLMTSEYDFLKENAKPMYELLKQKGISCVYKLYGKEGDNYMGHVFHLNLRLEEARMCNDEEY